MGEVYQDRVFLFFWGGVGILTFVGKGGGTLTYIHRRTSLCGKAESPTAGLEVEVCHSKIYPLPTASGQVLTNS